MSFAIITGASSGIGKAFAEALSRKKRPLILVARSEEKLHHLADSLRKKDGIEARVVPLDLSAAEAPQRLLEYCENEELAVDVLINNAGFGDVGEFELTPVPRIMSMISLNITSLVILTRLFLPQFVSRGSGAILNVASTAAFQAVPYFAVYAATKAFVLSFTEALNEEVASKGVRVTALCPGTTETQFFEVANHDPNRMLLPMEKPDDVVRVGLQALEYGEAKVISGVFNKALIHTQRLLPRSVVRKVGGWLFNPKRP